METNRVARLIAGSRLAPARRSAPRGGRRAGGVVRAVAFACAGAVLSAPVLASGPAPPAGAVTVAATAFPDGYVHLDGHGLGPGIGMGQWGAFGDAAAYHKAYAWILAHFYGGTVMSTMAHPDPQVSVAIIENDGAPVTVTSGSRFRIGAVYFAAGTAARAVMSASSGTWTVSEAVSCSAKTWTTVATGLTNPVFIPYSQHADAPSSELLTICRADGVAETVRGLVKSYAYAGAAAGSPPAAETFNLVRLDEYLADVVPSESSWGWGETGSAGPQGEPWGFQELEAQAVAARTYLLAYERAGGWDGAAICDSDYCQSYPGIENEAPVSTLSVSDTEGQYLTSGGGPADTQYSASTGGYTAPSQFPAVPDAGDAVCITSQYWTCNPDHDWSAAIKVTAVEAAFPTIGALQSVTVTSRNGLGDWGGRVLTLKVTGTKGSRTESGVAFEVQFGLDSDWFVEVQTTTTSTTPPPSAVGTGPLPLAGGPGQGGP